MTDTVIQPGAESAAAQAAFGWVAEHGDVLWRFCLARTRSPAVAEELVQDTLLAALRGYDRFRGASSERTWLLGIAARKVAAWGREQARRRRRERPDPTQTPGPGHPDAFEAMFTPGGMWRTLPERLAIAPTTSPDRADQLNALRRCLAKLPPGFHEAIWLRDLAGMPASEVCNALGLTASNLWTRLHRARAALRACVADALGLQQREHCK